MRRMVAKAEWDRLSLIEAERQAKVRRTNRVAKAAVVRVFVLQPEIVTDAVANEVVVVEPNPKASHISHDMKQMQSHLIS